MSESQKPIVLIAHGAWHRPLHYRLLINALKDQGYTVLAPPNATSGYSDSIIGKTHKDDVKRIHDDLLPYLDAGRKAILVAHSYGGVPATMAIEGQTVAEREARGVRGGIMSIIYVACGLPTQKGISMLEAVGGVWSSMPLHHVGEHTLPLKFEAAEEAFYGDVDKSLRTEAAAHLADQSLQPFVDRIDFIAEDVKISKIYVMCKQDTAVPFPVQQYVAKASGSRIVELDCGHSPFLKNDEREEIVKLVDSVSAT